MMNAGDAFFADKDRIMDTVLSFNVLKIRYEELLKIYSTNEEDFVRYKKRITTLKNKINELNNKIDKLIKIINTFKKMLGQKSAVLIKCTTTLQQQLRKELLRLE